MKTSNITQEEKARAYDEALKRAKAAIDIAADKDLVGGVVRTILPELTESEDEDERIRRTLVEYFGPKVQLDFVRGVPIQKIRDWLEKQKEQKPWKVGSNAYFTPEQNPKWSEEEKRAIDRACVALRAYSNGDLPEFLPSELLGYADRLQSLRPQPKKELSIEKAIQWLDDTFYFLDNSSGRGKDCEITTHDFDSLEEMYDSFRKAVTVDSQPHWKPSEEQMEALDKAIHVCMVVVGRDEIMPLKSLLRDLNKLR